MKATVRHTIDKVLFENKSDVFRYSEFICKYLPDYWKANQQRWEQVIDDCTVDISVDCIIDHPGRKPATDTHRTGMGKNKRGVIQ